MSDYPMTYVWGNNIKRAQLKGRACRIVARGTMNSVEVEFDDGSREITSRFAVRKSLRYGPTARNFPLPLGQPQ